MGVVAFPRKVMHMLSWQPHYQGFVPLKKSVKIHICVNDLHFENVLFLLLLLLFYHYYYLLIQS